MRSASWKILSLKIYIVVHGTSHERTNMPAGSLEMIVKLYTRMALCLRATRPNGSLGIFGKDAA